MTRQIRELPSWLTATLIGGAFVVSMLMLLAMLAGLGYGALQVLR